MSGLKSKQKSAGEVMNHHSGVSSSLSEGRCAGGEGGKTFTSPAACCVPVFVVVLRSRRGGFFTESSALCTPTFSAHSCVSTCLLWTSFLYTSSHKWGIWKLFLGSPSSHNLKPRNVSNLFLQRCLGGCMFLLTLPLCFGSDINNDEFLIRRNKQLSKNVTKEAARARFSRGFLRKLSVPFPACGLLLWRSRSLLLEPLFLPSLWWRRINSAISS